MAPVARCRRAPPARTPPCPALHPVAPRPALSPHYTAPTSQGPCRPKRPHPCAFAPDCATCAMARARSQLSATTPTTPQHAPLDVAQPEPRRDPMGMRTPRPLALTHESLLSNSFCAPQALHAPRTTSPRPRRSRPFPDTPRRRRPAGTLARASHAVPRTGHPPRARPHVCRAMAVTPHTILSPLSLSTAIKGTPRPRASTTPPHPPLNLSPAQS